jgi:calcineurin-like phosphoesterase
MLFKLFHALTPNRGWGEPPKFPEEYQEVAEVEAENQEDVFTMTNHDEWHKEDGVKVCVDSVRPTNVHDVVVGRGKNYLCQRVGWSII